MQKRCTQPGCTEDKRQEVAGREEGFAVGRRNQPQRGPDFGAVQRKKEPLTGAD